MNNPLEDGVFLRDIPNNVPRKSEIRERYLHEVHFEKQISNSCLFSDKAWIHLHGQANSPNKRYRYP